MNKKELSGQIKAKGSYLCVGLDSDITKIPAQFANSNDPVFEFNKVIIDQTKDLAVAYKLNIAFYESLGYKGWISLEKTLEYIPKHIFRIADAKRGDIGNTSSQYAKTFFETYDFDAITVSPYMGSDSVKPFLEFNDKWVIILALTSNKGSNDFQMIESKQNMKFYEHVLQTATTWGTEDNLMFVVGATHPEHFSHIRSIIPNHFILIPGVGTQGGDLGEISKHAINHDTGILVNVSRAIIFPDDKENFPGNVRTQAMFYQQEMSKFLK